MESVQTTNYVLIRNCSYEEVEHFDTPEARKETAHVYEGKTKHTWFCMELNGEIVGCSSLMPFSKREARLRGWYLMPEYRGQGLGVDLVRPVIGEAICEGYEYLESKTKHKGIMEALDFVFTGREYPSWGGYRYVYKCKPDAEIPMEGYESIN